MMLHHLRAQDKASLSVIVLLSIFLFFVGIVSDSSKIKDTPSPVKGVLDLKKWNLEENGRVSLSGEWTFYFSSSKPREGLSSLTPACGEHLCVPELWNRYSLEDNPFRYVAYKLKVQMDAVPSSLIGMRIPAMPVPYQVMADGLTLVDNGEEFDHKERAIEAYSSRTVYFKPASSQFDIIMQVSNGLLAGGKSGSPIELGGRVEMASLRDRELAGAMFFMGIAIMLGLYSIAVYLYRRVRRAHLYFGIICLLVAIRLLVADQLFVQQLIPQMTNQHIMLLEYLTYYGGITFAVQYMRHLFPSEFHAVAVKTLTVIGFCFSLSLLLFPAAIYTKGLPLFQGFTLIICVYFVYGLILAVCRRKDGACLQLYGIILVLAGFLHDYLLQKVNVPIDRQVLTIVTLILLLIQVAELARHHSGAGQMMDRRDERQDCSDRQKDEYLMMHASQELQLPLQGIINISQSILDGQSSRLTEEQLHGIQLILSVSGRLSKQVNDLLDFVNLKKQSLDLQIISLDVKAVIESHLPVFMRLAGHKPIVFKADFPEALPRISADEARLLQIVYNLVTNAIKFTEQGYVMIRAREEEGFVRIIVRDTGIEFEDSDGSNIHMEPSCQAEKLAGGAGLSYSVMKLLVELHGGELSIRSIVGEGSECSFTVPISAEQDEDAFLSLGQHEDNGQWLAVEHMAAVQPVIENGLKGNAPVILTVDDDLLSQQTVRQILQHERYRIIFAFNAHEALRYLNESNFIDLVLLDITIPGMSAYELIRQIRDKYSTSELPIVLVTAKKEQEDLLAGSASGANDFLIKPYFANELRARVKTLLDLKRSNDAAAASETAFLQAQIKPHFLYNTLNTILALSLDEPQQAHDVLTRLSQYLQRSFAFNDKSRYVSLSDEMELVKSYLYIERVRYGERLSITYQIDEALNLPIPPFIIQPLVENAVRHGVMKRKEGGNVTISIRAIGEEIMIMVRDDGVGIDPSRMATLLDENPDGRRGLALVNIHRRLLQEYGRGIELKSEPGAGTQIIIWLPESKGTAEGVEIKGELRRWM
ncbi:ATP-binding protein [Paenibacillus sp. NPDC058174]|uniref:hybrid sensor histidine kinase/response regulator n=1 Tax=Paenibacillus sp. NPDC058174 TaxID=3346366 RepID=UPI0036DB01BB